MSQCKMRADLPPKPGGPRREEMPTIQVKNTLLHLNGQNLTLASKNRGHSQAPGLHLSAAPGKEPQLTPEATPQQDTPLPRPQRPVLDKGSENQPSRRPLKLAPLDLPEEIRQAQTQKLKCTHGVIDKPRVKTSAAQSFTDQRKPSKPAAKHKNMEDVVCQGTQAPLLPKLVPNAPQVSKAKSKGSKGQDQAGKRRLRLTRGQCLEEEEAKANRSATGAPASAAPGPAAPGTAAPGTAPAPAVPALCPIGDKASRGVRSRGQPQVRTLRGSPQSGKGIVELPAVPGEGPCVEKSSRGDRRQAGSGTSAEGERAGPEGGSAAGGRLQKKKVLMTNKTLTLERLQL